MHVPYQLRGVPLKNMEGKHCKSRSLSVWIWLFTQVDRLSISSCPVKKPKMSLRTGPEGPVHFIIECYSLTAVACGVGQSINTWVYKKENAWCVPNIITQMIQVDKSKESRYN